MAGFFLEPEPKQSDSNKKYNFLKLQTTKVFGAAFFQKQ